MKRLRKWLLIAAAPLLILTVGVIGIFRSAWFQVQVHDRIVAEVEKATGGRAELALFEFDWHTLTATIRGFILHGSEPVGQDPLFRADLVRVRLKIISALERKVDLSSVEVDRPRAHVIVNPDGSTNIPGPKAARGGKNIIEQVLDLKINHFALRDGSLAYNSEVLPLDVSGDGLRAELSYQLKGPLYKGSVSASKVHIARPFAEAVDAAIEAQLTLRRNRLEFVKARVGLKDSTLDFSGAIHDLAAPKGEFSAEARIAVAELLRPFRLPVSLAGGAVWKGTGSFSTQPADFSFQGNVTGTGFTYRDHFVDLKNAALSGSLQASPAGVRVGELNVSALSGKFHGQAELRGWRDLLVNGSFDAISTSALAASLGAAKVPWSGLAHGTVQLAAKVGGSALRDTIAQIKAAITPGGSGRPVSGSAEINYDQRAGTLRFGSSHFATSSTTLDLSGILGSALQVSLVTSSVADLLPALPLLGVAPPDPFPFALKGGTARVDATITGPLRNPDIRGHGQIGAFSFEGHAADRLEAGFELNRGLLSFQDLDLLRAGLTAKGSGQAALHEWNLDDSSTISATLAVQNANVRDLLKEAESTLPLTGNGGANIQISGTFGAPQVKGKAQLTHVTAWNEPIDRISGDVELNRDTVRVTNAIVETGASRASGAAAYHRTGAAWDTGDLQFDVAAKESDVTRIAVLRDRLAGFAGSVQLQASGTGKIAVGVLRITSLNGNGSLENVSLHGSSLGSLNLIAKSAGSQLNVEANGKILDATLKGRGQWRLDGDHDGSASIDFGPLSLREAAMFLNSQEASAQSIERQKQLDRFNFAGALSGNVVIKGPFDDPSKLSAELRLPSVQLSGKPDLQARAGAQAQDLIIASTEPVLVDINSKELNIKSAHFTARDTKLSLAGRLRFDNPALSDLRADGSINLVILQLLNKDLLASGHAHVSAAFRGTLTKPELDGRMELDHASLFLPDLPNGVDNATGVIVFDRNRATIQSLSAETGGGKVSLAGFVGFGSVLVYRLQATADQVRYRSPQGVSFTADAQLSLVGTSESSVVSGSVTVVRANLTPLADVGGLLAQSAAPSITVTEENQYFRGMHFDISIESAQNLEVRTSLAHDVQASIDLHLRGTTQHPSLLGSLAVNQGEIEFFGSRYSIDRGEAQFTNPLKIEPTIDLSLETRVRGITVNLTLSGSLQKLNLSYRSDPPLESGQIVALLAVGRDPTTQGLTNPNATQSNPFAGSAGSLLAGALTAPLTNRLDKLFGGTRIKIDPQATDLTTIPQARLIFEQPISKDVTLTYITNLSRTDEQVVRVQWDFNPNWSAIASREENSLFGVVFQYRKRFK